MSSRFTSQPDSVDLLLDLDNADPLGLMLARDGKPAMWQGQHAPALDVGQSVYRERAVMWRNAGPGCGFSRRLPQTTAQGPDGQILSTAVSFGENATFVVPGIVMPSGKLHAVVMPAALQVPSARIFDGVEYGPNHDFYISVGTPSLLVVPNGDGTPELGSQSLGANFTSRALTVFGGNLIVSGEGSGAIWIYNGIAWSQAASAVKRSRLAKVYWAISNQLSGSASGGGTGAMRLIGTDPGGVGFYHIAEGDNPAVEANWSSVGGDPIPVGESYYPIQHIVSSGDVVWFAKPNGLHGVNEIGRAKNLTPWFERTYDPSNGGAVAFWSDDNRALAFIAHTQGLVAVSVNGVASDGARFVQFGSKQPNQTPISGRPRAICPYVDGLFVAYAGGYVMRLMLTDGGIVWSGAECVTPNHEDITFLKVTSPNSVPRLWIGTTKADGTPGLYWQELPQTNNPYQDYVQGTSHRFSTDWSVTIPQEDFSSTAVKVARRYDVVAGQLGDGNTASVFALADEDADGYVLQGAISQSPRSSFSATTYTTGVDFDWKVVCRNEDDRPIVLKSFQARASVLTEQVDIWTFRVQLAAEQGLLDDAVSPADPYRAWRRLKGYMRRGPIQARHPLSSASVTAKVEQALPYKVAWDEMAGSWLVQEALVTISVLRDVTQYDVGDSYDSGSPYA